MEQRERAKEFLLQYRKVENEIKDLELLIDALELEVDNIQVKLDGMPRGSDISDRTGKLAARLADYGVQAVEKRSRLWDLRLEIEDKIHQLDAIPAQILYLRYIQGKRFEQIAAEIGLSWRHMWRVYDKALDELGKNIEKAKNGIE